MWLIVIICVIAYGIHKYLDTKDFWKKQGVSSVTPWPVFGNMGLSILGRKAMPNTIQDIYNTFPNKRYVGFFNSTRPTLMIKDPELIKQIAVKEFDSFPEHRPFIPEGVDPLWSKNLFAMRGGEKWQKMRSTLSPAFTSSKLRSMFLLMKECSSKFSEHYLKEGGMVTVELKDAYGRFTNDVIGTTAFGVSCDSLKDPENEFYKKGVSLSSMRGFQGLKFFFYIFMPTISKMLKIKIFPEEVRNFFHTLVHETIKTRQEKSIFRPDMINLLMETMKGTVKLEKCETDVVQETPKTNFSDDEITAQCLIFYFAGFDTSSTMMSYASYELALHPNIQEALREEVDATLAKCDGNVTYESLLEMKYLDMVVNETLRKWPPFVITDRHAVKAFTINPKYPDEQPVHIKPGQTCLIPIHAIQRDPKYFPNPDKFDPERFSEENKRKILPSLANLSFGAGPRNCIGSRFALLEGKLILMEIISKFEIVPIEKTPIPIEFSKKTFSPIPEEGFWLGLIPRNKK